MSTQFDFFSSRAAEARADAEQATLANVRERCLRAEAAWIAMADRAHRGDIAREKTRLAKLSMAVTTSG
jgi:hypothetical protein